MDKQDMDKWAEEQKFQPLEHVIPVLQRGNIVLLDRDGRLIGRDWKIEYFTFAVENLQFLTGSQATSEPTCLWVFARRRSTGKIVAYFNCDGWEAWHEADYVDQVERTN